jgi:hypothetical protein
LIWDQDLEQQILGSLLSAPKCIPVAAEELTRTDFFLPTHQAIFDSICQLHNQSQTVDPFVVADLLRDNSEFRQRGGRSYLLTLTGLAHVVSDIRDHAALLRRIGLEREGQIIAQGYLSGEVNIEDLHDRTEELLGRSTCSISPLLTLRELFERTPDEPEWLVRGLVARGSITELTAKIKQGKTTFVLAMIAALLASNDFLGLSTSRVPVLYLTEERPSTFTHACRRVGLDPSDDFHLLLRQDSPGDWAKVGTLVLRETERLGVGLVVVDTLSDWAGLKADEENSSGAAHSAMRPLQAVAAKDVGVIVLRHEKKGTASDLADSSRGSSAFGGAADILLALRPGKGAGSGNRRQLISRGRYDDCPGELMLEMQDGEYARVGAGRRLSKKEAKDEILARLPHSVEEALSREQVETLCPEVSKTTIKESLGEIAGAGLLCRQTKLLADPRAYGYWIESGDEA